MPVTRKQTDAVLPDNLVAGLLCAMPPSRAALPTAKRRAAMKRNLLSHIAAESVEAAAIDAAEAKTVRSTAGRWITFAPNVAMKVLNDDGDTRTWLARFQPGGCIHAHMQTGDEEAYILEGWCYVGRQIMRKGDYQLIPKGARHGEIVSPEGCLVLVRSHSLSRNAAELTAAG